jgi:hypothetical protein
LNNKTVIRAGGGLYYGPGQFEDLIQPIESDVLRSNLILTGGTLNAENIGRINTALNNVPVATPQQNFTPRAYDVGGYSVPERVGQYGVSVQQELPGNTVLTVGYVGSQGRNLFQRNVTNTILPNTNPNGCEVIGTTTLLPTGCGIINRRAVAGGPVTQVLTIRQQTLLNQALNNNNQVVASPGSILNPFGEIDYKTSGGRDRYDALQVQVQRRFAAGLALSGQYTYAKSRGTSQGSNEAVTTQDPFNFEGEFGRNNFDIRHSANVTVLYELPIGEGKSLDLGNSFANSLLGDWQIGGIYNGRSGLPLNILVTRADTALVCAQAGGCPVNYRIVNGLVVNEPGTTFIPQGTVVRAGTPSAGFVGVINTPGGNASRNTRRPNLVSGVNPILEGGLNGDKTFFLNPAAFAIPAPGTYGNYPRNFLSGPNFHQFDFTLQKRFALTERINLVFRTEVFNIFNEANFANPPILLGENLPQLAINTSTTTGITTASVGSGLQPFSFERSANFGRINSTVGRTIGLGTNRQIQFALRLNF